MPELCSINKSSAVALHVQSVNILIADDHELVRAGIVSILQEQRPEWQIVAQASDGVAAAKLVCELNPSVLLLDLDLPGLDGLAVLKHVSCVARDVRVIVLSMHSGELVARKLKLLGAKGFVNKSDAPRLIVTAIEHVLISDTFFCSELAHWGRGNRLAPATARFSLSARELDVLRLLASGRANKEIAGDLDLSVRTVETHRSKILHKLRINSLGELVAIAIREQLV